MNVIVIEWMKEYIIRNKLDYSIVFVVHLGGLQFSFLGDESVPVEIEGRIETVSVLWPIQVSFQDLVGNPALPIQVGVVGGEPTALGEGLMSLQVFIGFPKSGVYLRVGVSEEVVSWWFHGWLIPSRVRSLNCCFPILTWGSQLRAVEECLVVDIETVGGEAQQVLGQFGVGVALLCDGRISLCVDALWFHVGDVPSILRHRAHSRLHGILE